MDTLDEDPTKCGRPKKHGDGFCGQRAGWGTPHPGRGPCKKHGGCLPTVVKAEQRRELESEARRMLAQLDVAPIDDPLTEMARLAGQVVAFKDQLADLVNQLQGEPIECSNCGEPTRLVEPSELRFTDDKGAEQLRSEVALWERALDRCNTVLSSYARLNIDDRLARITERQAATIIAAIDAALDVAEVTAERRGPARVAAARHLRSV